MKISLPDGVQVFTAYGATESLPIAIIGSDQILSDMRHGTAPTGTDISANEVIFTISDKNHRAPKCRVWQKSACPLFRGDRGAMPTTHAIGGG